MGCGHAKMKILTPSKNRSKKKDGCSSGVSKHHHQNGDLKGGHRGQQTSSKSASRGNRTSLCDRQDTVIPEDYDGEDDKDLILIKAGPVAPKPVSSDSQQDFFRALDEKIEMGRDYDSDDAREDHIGRLRSARQQWEEFLRSRSSTQSSGHHSQRNSASHIPGSMSTEFGQALLPPPDECRSQSRSGSISSRGSRRNSTDRRGSAVGLRITQAAALAEWDGLPAQKEAVTRMLSVAPAPRQLSPYTEEEADQLNASNCTSPGSPCASVLHDRHQQQQQRQPHYHRSNSGADSLHSGSSSSGLGRTATLTDDLLDEIERASEEGFYNYSYEDRVPNMANHHEEADVDLSLYVGGDDHHQQRISSAKAFSRNLREQDSLGSSSVPRSNNNVHQNKSVVVNHHRESNKSKTQTTRTKSSGKEKAASGFRKQRA